MKRILAAVLLAVGAMLSAPAVWAEDLALIVANEFYQNHPRVQRTGAITGLERNFRDAGFAVVRLNNTRSNFGDSNGDALWRRLNRAERLVVVLSGHVVRANDEGWLLHTNAGKPNGFTIGRDGLAIRPILDRAAAKQGDAVVAIANAGGPLNLGVAVHTKYVPRAVAQGVTVLTGNQRQIGDFIANALLVPGQSLSRAIRQAPEGFRAFGYLPRSRAFIPAARPVLDTRALENTVWQSTRALNTINAYESFLSQFPNGQHAAEARRRLDGLRLTPQDRARIAEESLGLTRDQRRSIQRNLTLLGFDTFGIDGVLGRRSRTAIARWQASIGVGQSGYLTANQVSRLEVAAAARAEQLRREAEERRRAEERRDRAYWNQTGASGTEAGLHAYLQRYPDGIYSEGAQEALRAIEREQRRLARVEERQAWDRAVMEGTLQSYQEYLNQYPDGRFAEEARARVASLSNPETPPAVIAAARQEEESLALNGFRRQLVESQLRAVGLKPGAVDGKFDRATRRALRQYQRANGLPVTGFVTRATIVRLLASAFNE